MMDWTTIRRDVMPSSVWFTADLHFGHKNILEYGRGEKFNTIEEHDEYIAKTWNENIRPGDRVYILGDVSFNKPIPSAEIVSNLNGQKFLIIGNHDKRNMSVQEFRDEFVWCRSLKSIGFKLDGLDKKQQVVMCHFPLMSWDMMNMGSWQLHGHCHGSLVDPGWSKRMDVGLDCNDYKPFNLDDIRTKMNEREFVRVDHHKEWED